MIDTFVDGSVWTVNYAIRYAGARFSSRMTILRLRDGRLLLHSPCEIGPSLREEIACLGEVAYIVAPGSFHYFYVESCQRAFPNADTYLCPGVERKRPRLEFDWILGDRPPPEWGDEIDLVLVRGSRFIWELAFLHRSSRTLVLVDLVENIGDGTPGTDRMLRFWWKVVFRMWNRPKPAPEYQFGWSDRVAAQASLRRILSWDFDRVLMAHGDPIRRDAKRVLRDAWQTLLRDAVSA